MKAEAARAQLDAERESTRPASLPSPRETAGDPMTGAIGEGVTSPSPLPRPAPPTRFHGGVTLDPERVCCYVSRIAEEVIAHLVGLVGADVRVTLEIEARTSAGVPDHIVQRSPRTAELWEFESQGFEED